MYKDGKTPLFFIVRYFIVALWITGLKNDKNDVVLSNLNVPP